MQHGVLTLCSSSNGPMHGVCVLLQLYSRLLRMCPHHCWMLMEQDLSRWGIPTLVGPINAPHSFRVLLQCAGLGDVVEGMF